LHKLRKIEDKRIETEDAEKRAREEAELGALQEAEKRAREQAERREREEAEQQRLREEQLRREEREERLRLEEIRHRARVEAELSLERARLAVAVKERTNAAKGRWIPLVAGAIVAAGLFIFLAQGWRAAATRAHERKLELIAIAGRHDQKSSALRRARDELVSYQKREQELSRQVVELRGALADASQTPSCSKRRVRGRSRRRTKPSTPTPPVIPTRCENSDDPIDCIKKRGKM
jgi:hypothetical protein